MKEKTLILIAAVMLTTGILSGCVQQKPVNKKPIADFSFSPESPEVNETVNFTDKSIDPDGNVTSWQWDFDGDGVTDSTLQNPTYKYIATGVYNITLIVKDSNNATDSITKSITVSEMNIPPIANFTFTVGVNLTVNFTDLSNDSDGYIVNWTWDFGDGNISYEQNPQHKYADDGVYNVTLTVTDDKGKTGSIIKPVNLTISE